MTHLDKLKKLAQKWGSIALFYYPKSSSGSRQDCWLRTPGDVNIYAKTPEQAIEKAYKEEFPDEVL